MLRKNYARITLRIALKWLVRDSGDGGEGKKTRGVSKLGVYLSWLD